MAFTIRLRQISCATGLRNDAEYTNIVSAAASKNAATDQFKGKLSHVLYNYKGVGTYWVNEWTCKDGAKTKYTGSEAKDYTVALSDFVNTTYSWIQCIKGIICSRLP